MSPLLRKHAVILAGLLLLHFLACTGAYSSGNSFEDYPGKKILINVPAYRLYLYEGSTLIKSYEIAIGKPTSPSPDGEYKIINKVTNPTWYPSNGSKPVPPGPKNPLGTRWMGLSKKGYGIHGNNNPSSIGQSVSNGCIRMKTNEAEELFNHVKVGTPVKFIYQTIEIITDSTKSSFYYAVYQDIYNKGTNNINLLQTELKKKGFSRRLFIPATLQSLKKPDILPKPVYISISVVINSVKISDGFSCEGKVYVPVVEMLNALKLGSAKKTENGLVYVSTSDSRELTFPCVLYDNKAYISLDEYRSVFSSVNTVFDASSDTLSMTIFNMAYKDMAANH